MTVEIKVEWESEHEIEPPDGESEDAFRSRLSSRDEDAWQHALDQVYPDGCSLSNWELR